MNHRTGKENLLDQVLAESASANFRTEMLSKMLSLARRRRQWRQARRTGGALVVVLLVGWLAWQRQPEKVSPVTPMTKTLSPQSYQLVKTQPLPANDVVTTKDFAGVNVVSSKPSVALATTTGGGFRYINDQQLLALVGSRPAVLIRTGPNSEKLFFADAADQKLLSPR